MFVFSRRFITFNVKRKTFEKTTQFCKIKFSSALTVNNLSSFSRSKVWYKTAIFTHFLGNPPYNLAHSLKLLLNRTAMQVYSRLGKQIRDSHKYCRFS